MMALGDSSAFSLSKLIVQHYITIVKRVNRQVQIDRHNVALYYLHMNDIQERIEALQANGWTLAAIGDEVGTHRESVSRWKSGMYYPENSKAVLMALDTLLQKKPPSCNASRLGSPYRSLDRRDGTNRHWYHGICSIRLRADIGYTG